MKSLVKQKEREVARLCKRYKVKKLELFGSATNDRFEPDRSDLDFLVVFETSTPAEHASCYFGLLEGLQDLFGREIDLVEAGAIRNPYFREDIQATRIRVYES